MVWMQMCNKDGIHRRIPTRLNYSCMGWAKSELLKFRHISQWVYQRYCARSLKPNTCPR